MQFRHKKSLWTRRMHKTHAARHMHLIKHALVLWRERGTAAVVPCTWHVYNPAIWIHYPDLASAHWGSAGLPNKGAWGRLRYYSTGPLGISVRDPLFQGRYHVSLTIPLAPASVKPQSSGAGCLAVRLSPASHPSADHHSSSLWTGAKQARASDSVCSDTHAHTFPRQAFARRPRGGPHAVLRAWRLRPVCCSFSFQALVLGSAGRSCTHPLSGPRYIYA